MSVGSPMDPTTDIGPLVSERQRDRVEAFIRSGIEEGAELMCGGSRPAVMTTGWYVEPTVFTAPDSAMTIAQEEIFGPVLTVIPHDGPDDAVRIANDSIYGLSGTIWGADPEQCEQLAKRVRTGVMAINSGLIGDVRNPFGGFKRSGIGREMGREGLEGYLETQTLILPA
jgi:aldehyde dehydrogenase (NAD+)